MFENGQFPLCLAKVCVCWTVLYFLFLTRILFLFFSCVIFFCLLLFYLLLFSCFWPELQLTIIVSSQDSFRTVIARGLKASQSRPSSCSHVFTYKAEHLHSISYFLLYFFYAKQEINFILRKRLQPLSLFCGISFRRQRETVSIFFFFSFVLMFLQSDSGCRFLGYYIGVPCQYFVQTREELSQHTTQPAGERLENTCHLFFFSLSPLLHTQTFVAVFFLCLNEIADSDSESSHTSVRHALVSHWAAAA